MRYSDFCHDMDHFRKILDEYPFAERIRNRRIDSWEMWLAWCQDHNLHPGEARREDMDRFLEQLPSHSRASVREDLSAIYVMLGGPNPARWLRPITPDGRAKHDRRWAGWVTWCGRMSVSPLPADADQLAAYLKEVARKISRRCAQRALSAISRTHAENDLADPKMAAPVVQAMEDIKQLDDLPVQHTRTHTGESPQTIRRDQGIWNRWSKWCVEQGIDPMSAKPQDVVAFITFKRRTGTYDYVRLLVYSLKTTYRRNGSENNPADSEDVVNALRTMKDPGWLPEEGDDEVAPSEDDGFPGPDDLSHLAPSTQRTYRSYWRTWSMWCEREGIDPLDASPEQIAVFLVGEADRIEMKSVELNAPAIACVYDVLAPGKHNPARDGLVRQTMRGLKRQKHKPPDQMTGLTAEGLARIQATARRPRPWESERQALVRGTTDLAMIGIMRDGMLRVSEAAALTWDDLTEEVDGSGRLCIRRSKTDQTGKGAVVFISRQTMGWLKEMREMVMEGPTMFGITRGAIYTRIVDALRYAGLEERYGGHSPRIGMTQDLGRANFSLPLIMNAGRWKSPSMPAYYLRGIAAGFNAVAQWYVQRPGRALIEPIPPTQPTKDYDDPTASQP